MEVKVENVSNVKKRLIVEIPNERVKEEIDKAFDDLKKKAVIKGFRVGKVPRSVLERYYKKDVYEDVAKTLVEDTFPKAIKEAELSVIETEELDSPPIDPTSNYKYEVLVQHLPEIPEIQFGGLKLKKTDYKVSDKEIEAQLEILSRHLAEYKPITDDRPVTYEDIVVIDAQGFKDGEPFEDAPYRENSIVKIAPENEAGPFEKALIGMKIGEERTFDVKYPEDHPKNELAGQTITFTVRLREIQKEIIPALDDENIKKLGDYSSVEELKDKIRSQLQAEYDKRSFQELAEQVYEALIPSELDVPDALVEQELEGMHKDAMMYFARHGLSMESVGMDKESFNKTYRENAVKLVQRKLFLAKIIEQEKLKIKPEVIEAKYREIADHMGQPLETIKSFYEKDPNARISLEHTILEKKALDLILDNAEIETVSPEPEGDDTPEAGAGEEDTVK